MEPTTNAPTTPGSLPPAPAVCTMDLGSLTFSLLCANGVTGIWAAPDCISGTTPEHPRLPVFHIRAPSGALYVPVSGPEQLAGRGSFGHVMRYHCPALAESDAAAGLPRMLAVKLCFAGTDAFATGRFYTLRADAEELGGAHATCKSAAAQEGAVVASRVIREASRLAHAQLEEADPDAWTAVLMEHADGTALHLAHRRGPAAPGDAAPLTAAEAAGVVLQVAEGARTLFEQDRLVHADIKAGNVLAFRRGGGGCRLALGDLGGVVRRGKNRLPNPPTFPVPGLDKNRQPRTESVPAWGCLALLLQLFPWRLVPGSRPPAWKGLAFKSCSRDNLLELCARLAATDYGADRDAALVRDLFLEALPRDPATGAPCPARLTLDRVISYCATALHPMGSISTALNQVGRLLPPSPLLTATGADAAPPAGAAASDPQPVGSPAAGDAAWSSSSFSSAPPASSQRTESVPASPSNFDHRFGDVAPMEL